MFYVQKYGEMNTSSVSQHKKGAGGGGKMW